jgi:uncharacterized phage-associated protein
MPVSPQAVANKFLELARANGKQLTNMQLQKLVFLAQGYSLALLDKSLFEKDIHAWQWGPVIPSLYNELRKYGSGVVSEALSTDDAITPSTPEAEIIEGVWEGYGSRSGAQLSALTHQSGSPWEKQWNRKKFDAIPPDEIKVYYKKLAEA